ncbi:two-component system response regulator NarL [Yersinia aleksiciae]|uniref:two-component system response regulator NarL n=1 Tax=Yersinia aleksiciae TaxID=263819 RepID=UPI0011A32377|nr:two-component system response regulator NarL [Yersinia aleksiciae]MDN0124321.1 two-component system response regulator NarL [Yersinia aleksiciae]
MSEKNAATILLIDDHPMLRNGIKQLVSMAPGLSVVAETSNGAQGVVLATSLDPDLIMLDLNMPDMNGLETLDKLRQQSLSGRIVVFTVSDHQDDVISMLKHGADGYLLKDMDPEDLLVALYDAAAGKMVISDTLISVLTSNLRENDADMEHNINILTPREYEILMHISKGLSNKIIAKKLLIADGTVKVHVKHLLKKMKFRSRVEAAVWVIKNNILGV